MTTLQITLRDNFIESRNQHDAMLQRIAEAKENNAPLGEIVKMQWEAKELNADTTRWSKLMEEFRN